MLRFIGYAGMYAEMSRFVCMCECVSMSVYMVCVCVYVLDWARLQMLKASVLIDGL